MHACIISRSFSILYRDTYSFNLKSSVFAATNTPSSLKYNPVIVGSAKVEINAPRAWNAAVRT